MSVQNIRAPLRVTLALPSTESPAWVWRTQDRLQEADFLALTTVAVDKDPVPENRGSLLFNLWMRFETTVFGHKIASPGHSERPVSPPTELDPVPEDIETDVIVWMLPGRPPPELIGKAKHGVMTIAGAFDPMYGLNEFLDQEPATRCDIVVFGAEPSEDLVLVSSFARTDSILFSKGINEIRAKCVALLLATLNRFRHGADPRLDGLPQEPVTPSVSAAPGGLRIIRGLTFIFARFVRTSLFPGGEFDQWQLAYRLGGDRLDQSKLQYLAPEHTGFWADPFIAEQDGRRFIFFEELSPETKRGHLAAVEVYPDGRIGEPVNILMSDHHLSYPFVFEHQGSLFMAPECGSSGRVEVLRCDRFPDRWESHAVLLDGVTAFDPTLVEHDGRWWMFVTMQHNGNSCNDELHLFHTEDVFGEWTPHTLNPVRLDVRAARPAGALFRENGKLYRPAQDCSGRYGRAISIQEIRRMTPDEYEEVEVQRISAEFKPAALATHTVNQAHGIVVYDCQIRARKKPEAEVNTDRNIRQQTSRETD